MKKRLSFLTFLLTLVAVVCAQPRVKVSGTVVDKDTGDPLIAATVRITSTDGVDETFGITNDKGTFSFNVARPGSFRAEFSYVGYKKLTKNIQVRPGDNALGKIKMTEEVAELKNVSVVAKNKRVTQEADTTVFNADGYKVMAGATAEELLSKMPGMKISDGKIEAQGEEVKKVLVDGKAFFENDPTLALRVLPAEVVQSVAVFDKKSDQAELTGFDDGNSVKAIDVRTRSYKRNGVFGKVYGMYGTDDRYNVGGNVNFFNGDRRFTIMGLSNNVNQQNFSIDDILGAMGGSGGGPGGPGGMRGGGGGGRSFESRGSQGGITSANAIGTNYSDTWGKVEVQGSYFFNMTKNFQENEVNRNYFDTIAGHRIYDQYSQATTHNYSHRFNMRLTYKPNARNEFRFTPNLNFQKYDSDSYSADSTTVDKKIENTSSTTKSSDSHGYNLSGDFVWFHKFKKAGRTLSIMANGGATKNDGNSNSDITLNDSPANLVVDNNSAGYNFGGNVMYSEPLRDNRHQLALSYSANFSNTHTDKQTDSIYVDRADVQDPYQTSKYRSNYATQSASVGYRINTDKLRMMANLGVQYANLDGRQDYYVLNRIDNVSKDYVNVIPMLMLDFMPAKTKTLRVMYRANTSSPSISQLQNAIDVSNPLQLYQGNPDLNQSVEHSLSARYISSDIDKATNWMVNVDVTKKFDYIGSRTVYYNTDMALEGEGIDVIKGAQLTTPVNLDGYISVRSGVTYGFPIDFLMSNLNISANVNYSKTPGQQWTYNSADNPTKQDLNTRSLSFVPDAVLTSNISENLDFTLSYNASFQQVKNNLRKDSNYNYLTHNGRVKLSWIIWKGITMEHNLNWTCYTGSAMDKREDFWQWNASLGKKFLKNDRAELKLTAYDILKQNRAFSRTIADAYIQTSYSNVLTRYFALTFTYNIQAFKKGSTSKSGRSGRSEVIGSDKANSEKEGEGPQGMPGEPPGGGPGGMEGPGGPGGMPPM